MTRVIAVACMLLALAVVDALAMGRVRRVEDVWAETERTRQRDALKQQTQTAQPVSVPEPSTLLLTLAGVGLAAVARRRSR